MWRRVLVWVAVVPGVLWTVIRLSGWDGWYPATQLIAFTPYVAAGALLGVPLIALTRRWAATGVAAVTAVLLVGCVAPRALGDGDPQAGATGPGLRVATANVLVGSADAAHVVRLIADRHIDVLATQEMTPQWLASADAAGLRDLLPYRADASGPHISGLGLFSRYPLSGADPRPLGGGFGTLRATLSVPGAQPIIVESVHPASPYSAAMVPVWRAQLERQTPATPHGPFRLLLGDFNATLDHAPLRRLLDTGYRDAAEVTGDGLTGSWGPYDGDRIPPVTIDHVLADRRIGVREVHVVGLPGSDHRLVEALLMLPSAP